MSKLLLTLAFSLGAGVVHAADTASWTNWTDAANGSFVQNANTINVTYSGQTGGVYNSSAPFTAVLSSFTSPTVTNTPVNSLQMTGGLTGINTFTFSQAVINPLIAVWSVGQPSLPVSFNFLNNPTFTILSQGAGNWGGGSLTQSGSSITGYEGNGVIQFQGSFTSISFTTPNFEDYYGATVGAPSIAAVPEPETYAMLVAGLGLLGAMARRKKQKQLSA